MGLCQNGKNNKLIFEKGGGVTLRLLLCTLVCAVCISWKTFGGILRKGDFRRIFLHADNDINKN